MPYPHFTLGSQRAPELRFYRKIWPACALGLGLSTLMINPGYSVQTEVDPGFDPSLETIFSINDPANLTPYLAQNAAPAVEPILREDGRLPATEPLPEPTLPPQLPPPSNLVPSPTTPPSSGEATPEDVPDTVVVERFEVIGSTVFSAADFDAVTAAFTNRPITFRELFQAREAVTQLYVSKGYVTSGAYIPPQTLTDGVVQIHVLEGQLDTINVTGNERLQSAYISSRLGLAAAPPLNVDRLLEGLQLLQLDPLIETLSAELSSGVRPGTNTLNVIVREAEEFDGSLSADNGRSSSVGSFRQQVRLSYANLSGIGDRISLGYNHTAGSQGVDLNYTVPVSPHNATVSISTGVSKSSVIEAPFSILDIQSFSRYLEVTYRHPVVQTPTEEFALSLTASRQESRSEFLGNFGGAIPFTSIGSDASGRTNISAIRFAQEWTQRSNQQVIAARSQFNIGLGILGATVNSSAPDSRFLSWRGQAQWVRLLAPDTLLVMRGDLQLSLNSLVAQEQFGLGGSQTVRGYRQDQLLTDNGFLASTEVRIPMIRLPEQDSIVHIIPFVDFGMGWNTGNARPNTPLSTLISAGLGLNLQIGDDFTARLDWGIPLNKTDGSGNALQSSGIHFSLTLTPF